MVSKEIERIAKDSKRISEEFFNATPERQTTLKSVKDSRSNKKIPNTYIPDEMASELKEFYIEKIGRDSIAASPDYDTDLIRIQDLGTIKDLNFPDSFLKVFAISLAAMFFSYFLFAFFSLLFGGIISLACGLLAWIVPLMLLWVFYADHRDEEKLFMNSSKKSESKKQKVSRVKYAPVVSFLILAGANLISSMYLASMIV